ncbi:invertebrate-type lysozyme-like [Mercenaria mercenaria]|uniref:invertebrate-type lysozyme-like n=1 Tax=Mercenaria mercenaria TaxID=6596 RepID=UPI001E1DC7ED|nr:invertebrate-type lysozyme-like [Mercenaria mercenaria]
MKMFCMIFFSLSLVLAAAEMFKETSVQEVVRETVVDYPSRNASFKDELIQTWYNSEMEEGLEFAPGIVSQQCLRCICLVESNCKPASCHMDVGSLSCGYFQIKKAYWTDCGKPGGDWKKCAQDKQCSSQCVQNYMARYAKRYGCPLKCEGFAREHNGGPNGCHNPNTLKYWEELQKKPGCRGVQLP